MNISVKALIVRNDKVLLLKPKNTKGSFRGWDGPGGYVEKNEQILHALKREIFEETGILIDKAYPFYLTNIQNINKDYLIFICTTSNQKITLSDEHIAYKWLSVKLFKKFLGKQLVNELNNFNQLVKNLLK